jgi:hypothetical protein
VPLIFKNVKNYLSLFTPHPNHLPQGERGDIVKPPFFTGVLLILLTPPSMGGDRGEGDNK